MSASREKNQERPSVLLLVVFILGLSVMLYPSLSEFWNAKHQSRAIASYTQEVEKIDHSRQEAMLAEAQEYNARLAEHPDIFVTMAFPEGYQQVLNLDGTGIMGYVSIEKLHVELPIYHGTAESTLQVAAGHLEGTSLPVGGKGSHCVISAHRGLPSAKLFTDLDRMELSDTFTLTVLGEVYTYMVDNIQIVEPSDLSQLFIREDRDYCTLMTCTPYGINTHRMLVRGVRIGNQAAAPYVQAEAYLVNSLLVALVIAIPMLCLGVFILLGLGGRSKRVQKRAEQYLGNSWKF